MSSVYLLSLPVVLRGSHARRKPFSGGPDEAGTETIWLGLPHLKFCTSELPAIAASVSKVISPESDLSAELEEKLSEFIFL